MIDTATNSVVATISGIGTGGFAFTPDGTPAYVTNLFSSSVSVIETASNAAIATIGVVPDTQGLGMTPDGTRAYVASFGFNSIFVIDTATNTVSATILGGANPVGVAIAPSSLTTLTSSLTPYLRAESDFYCDGRALWQHHADG